MEHVHVGAQLKCDAPGCGHHEAVAEITADLVGKPCPLCGASLLTPEDFAEYGPMRKMFALLAAILPKPKKGEPLAATKIGVNVHNKRLTMTVEPASVSEALAARKEPT